ncbi:MAG: hypothetical protein ABEJ64_02655 [Candidatus Nanohaloarchaea archaeon]
MSSLPEKSRGEPDPAGSFAEDYGGWIYDNGWVMLDVSSGTHESLENLYEEDGEVDAARRTNGDLEIADYSDGYGRVKTIDGPEGDVVVWFDEKALEPGDSRLRALFEECIESAIEGPDRG